MGDLVRTHSGKPWGVSERLHKALKLAYRAHKRQDRDGESPLPYLTHAVDVVNRLRYVGLVTDETILAAAFLHDCLEETDLTPERIEEHLGPEIRALVQEVTREEPDPSLRENYSEEDWYALRTEIFLCEIEKMSPSAHLIKLADRGSNLRGAIATRSPEKLARYRAQSAEILARIPRDLNPALWDEVQTLIG